MFDYIALKFLHIERIATYVVSRYLFHCILAGLGNFNVKLHVWYLFCSLNLIIRVLELGIYSIPMYQNIVIHHHH